MKKNLYFLTIIGLLWGSSVMAADITFSQNVINIPPGQSAGITVTGGSDHYAQSNTNPGLVTISANGSSVVFNAASSTGTAVISICAALGNMCGTVTVNVTGSGTANSSVPTLTPNSLNLAPGTTRTVSISGIGAYFISGNSNSGAASPTLNGNILSVTAVSAGSSAITVCQSGGCSTLPVTVGAGSSGGGSLAFSQTAPSLGVGQTITVSVSGGTGIYSLSLISNPSVVSSSLSSGVLTITGLSMGSASITICESGGSCGSVTVSVGAAAGNSGAQAPSTVPSTPVSSAGSIAIPANFSFSGDIVASLLNQMKSIEDQVSRLIVQISDLNSVIQKLANVSSASGVNSAVGSSYKFTQPLSLGDSGSEVKELQKRLAAEGLYSGAVDGFFGKTTLAAVQAYQALHGISQLGNVGPATRASLNGG